MRIILSTIFLVIGHLIFANEVDFLMRNDSIPISFKIKKLKDLYRSGKESKDQQTAMISSLALVSIYTNQEKNIDSASKYLSESYNLLPQIKSNRIKSKFYYISGNVELNAENFKKALFYFVECNKIVKQDSNPDSYNLPILYNSIGVAHYNLNESDSALFYIDFAYHQSLKRGDTIFAVHTLGNLASIGIDKDLSKLEKIIFQLDDLIPAIKDSILISRVNLIYANYFIKKKELEQAKSKIELALKFSNNSEEQLVEVYLEYSNYYQAINNSDKALLYYKNYVGLRDSLRITSKKNKLANFESFYNSKIREEELKTERERLIVFQEKSKRRELLFYSILIVSILFLGLIILYILRLYQRAKQKKFNLQRDKEIQELKIENISHQLENKEKDLSNIAIDIARRNEFASKVQKELSSIQRKSNPESIKESIQKLQRYVRQQENVNKNLEHLQIETDKINFEFYQKLDGIVTNLTKKEKQLCAFIRMELSNSEIASLMGISPDTLKNNKSKLKKKFNLNTSTDFNNYIIEI